jgi:hypothetical protein
MNLLISLHSIF